MFSEPKKIIDQCSIQPGMIIADFGAGSGFYVMASAQALMSSGRVYAIDVQQDLLTRLQKELRAKNISNVDIVLGDVEKIGGTKLATGSVDLVFVCNVLFQIEDKKGALGEAKRILKPGGRMLLVDWAESFGGIGPRPDHVLPKEHGLELCENNGFSKEREVEAGAHHYGFIFKKL